MEILILIILVLIWWGSGYAGFIFWWTKDYNLRLHDLIVAFIIGLIGPFTWLLGYTIHGKDKILFKKQKDKV